MASRVVVKDNGAAAMLRRMQQAATVSVGVHEEDDVAYDDGASVAAVASFHEFGQGVPRRSWLADYVDENRPKLESNMRSIAGAVVKGPSSMEQGLDRFGLLQVGNIQQRIRGGILPALEQQTIERKGSSTPLVDSATFINSIRHKVESKESK